ncbi:hypothetical protein N9Y42_05735 [Mariniblastus sp.]|nr:hypothetical protein [Mariniblastus sp.]
MSSIWNWFYDYCDSSPEAEEVGELFDRGWNIFSDSPEEGIHWFKKARDLAAEHGHQKAALMCDHWHLQVLLKSSGDLDEMQRIAVAATVAARAPELSDLPQRVCLHEDLIYTFILADPFGFSKEIEQSLEYMATEVDPSTECARCLLRLHSQYALAKDDRDHAAECISKHRAQNQGASSEDVYHRCNAMRDYCQLAFQREEWQELLDAAIAGVPDSQEYEQPPAFAEFMAWQALACRRLNDEPKALIAYKTAEAQMSQMRLETSFFDAMSAFHESADEIEAAIKIRNKQLQQFEGSNRHWQQCNVLIQRGRLFQKSGKAELAEQDFAAATELATSLRSKATVLDRVSAARDE